MLRSDPRIHYKMYKAKKNMVYAALFSFAILGGLGLSQNAKADTVENNSITPAVQTVANSAQSTTGATPQSMLTQSAVPTQSPAAALNTSNSAPTAQPVSAQPVSTNKANSASNVADQDQTTTLNVQPVQPARNSAVTNQARLYVQSLAQVPNQQSAVSNVSVNYTVADAATTHKPGMPWYATVHTEFDLDTGQAQLNQPILLGHYEESSDTNGHMAITMPVTQQPVYYHQQRIGYLTYDNVWSNIDGLFTSSNNYKFVLTTKPNAVGTIHLVTDSPYALYINQDNNKNFRGIQTSHNTLKFINTDGQTTTSATYTIQQKDDYTRFDQEPLSTIKGRVQFSQNHWLGFANTSGDGNSNAIITISWPELDGDEVAQALHSNNISNPLTQLNKTYTMGGRVYLKNGGTVLNARIPGTGTVKLYGFSGSTISVDSQGRYIDHDSGLSGGPFVNDDLPLTTIITAPGLTLQQMKSQADLTKNQVLVSQQNDGSLLYLVNFTPDLFKNSHDYNEVLKMANGVPQANADKDPDKAAKNTADAIMNVFHNTPEMLGLWMPIQIADPTVANQLESETLDVNTGKVINTDNAEFTPNTYMAHGQAAVKLHVINATNGTELNQVQNFVDWPNQGKKANLSLPSIKGYQVVSDASAASAALQKLGLSGTAVTQAESVDYPAADNTANYYIVMNPVTETATVHFIDQDSNNKELSHVDLTGAYNTPVTANNAVNNMLNGYVNMQGYELVSNDLAGNHLYTDVHQDFNIVLKHKTHQRNPADDPIDAIKTITRTINVHNPDGSVKTTKQVVKLTREGVQDAVTSQTNWGAWSTGNWDSFTTPTIANYTPSIASVSAQAVDADTKDQTIDITYKANILHQDIDFTVPEVIHRTDQHGQTTIDRTQNVTLHGTVDYDAANNRLVNFVLHSADFPAYDVPQIDGYTSHVQEDHIVSLIPDDINFDKDAFVKDPSGYFNSIMKGRQGGLDHMIDAKSVPQTTAMQYKDGSVDRSYDFYITYTADPQSAQVIYYDTILKKNVKVDTLNGKTDETVKTNIAIPANYVLVPGQNLPATYTFKGSNNQNIVINLTHATKDTTATDPGAHKTVTRTIVVNTPHDGTKTTKQDVQLTRPATLDLVTNTTTYGNWNTGTWAQYDVPAVPGYTPDQASVPQVTVNGDTQDTTVTVNYKANPHVQVIEYVGDGKVQHTQNVNGVTDQTVNGIQPEIPVNWVLAPGAKVPTSVTFGPNDPQPIIVNIVHKTQDVTPTDAGAHKTITRTIHVNDPHNGVATTNQVVNLTRPAWFDFVTNDVHYGSWNTGNWAEFDSPAVAGYTVNPAKVAAQTVTSDTKDTIVNVNYTANPQQVTLNFVDKAGNVIATHLYKGVTDGTAKIDAQVPANWVLVPDQTIPASYTFKASDNHDIDIVIEHGTKDTSKTDKNAVRDVTRIINLHDPHKGTTTTKQVAHLHRSVTLDLVTNQTTYGKWDTDAKNWTEFDVPAVAGYTPNMSKVAAATVDENTKDQTIDVNYAANPQQVVLNFVDKAGNVIASHTYKGVTDGTAKIDAQVPANWQLVKGQTIPADYTFKAEGNKDIDILIEHGTQDVSKTDEKANKDITRTIVVTNPDGKKNTTVQTAHLNRSAIKDLVTGEVTYGQWNTGKWDAFDTPTIAGYDASIHHLDGQSVDINDEDQVINIHYNALTHTQDINYVDDNGDVVGTQVVTGRTGETAGFTPDVPNGYEIVPGQDIPKSFTFGANDPKTLVIHVTKPNAKSDEPSSTQPESDSNTPASSADTNLRTPAQPASTPTATPSAAPASGMTTETGYAAPATAMPVANAAAPMVQASGNADNGQGTLPQTGDDSMSAIAGLSLAGMTGAILAAGALKRRHA